MNACCPTEADNLQQRRTLWTVLLINAFMFAAELGVGIWADSTSLIADSLDMLADASVYSISLYAVGRAASIRRGAARFNGSLQLALGIGVLVDASRRAFLGSDPVATLMMWMGTAALIANIACLLILLKHRRGEVNIRASFICSINDVVANAGVILSGLLVQITGSRFPDLIIGLIISAVVVRGAIQILAEARRAEV
ncbi:Co/Zn/Cd efflux system component [Rhodopirellula maiorica SM1]|uniref:Co/Zn/Cd efflux system component n=1 Tax=Rhodopirellula maiorica SM1 TaxID=1265738 RepID=M5RCC1_9BACT|nr:cation transporter [Rhodopirellula maiorica]EMI16711.1 Co/Zn/Cd efflux system component [Rhodopirellula maiorica SM1]